ncbi:MAG: response regulator [Pseudomonadota bacterium]
MADNGAALIETMRKQVKEGADGIEPPRDHWTSEALSYASLLALAVALAVAIFALIEPQRVGWAGLILMVGVAAFVFIIFMGLLSRSAPTELLLGGLWRRVETGGDLAARDFAGAQVLRHLGLSDRILNGDPDAVLITKPDGVVVYANKAYRTLARAAGIGGLTGLPPRIDRLFAQGGEASEKVFRLCRAARAGASAREQVGQLIGARGAPKRRIFDIRIHPLDAEHIVWRLEEIAEKEAAYDPAPALAAAPAPVFALAPNGAITWMNAAAEAYFTAAEGRAFAMETMFPDAEGLAGSLLRDAAASVEAVAAAKEGPADVVLRAYSGASPAGVDGGRYIFLEAQGGVTAAEPKSAALAGAGRDAPFGVAIIEGDPADGASVQEANKAFGEIFGLKDVCCPLSDMFAVEDLENLSALLKKKGRAADGFVEAEATVDGEARTVTVYARPARRKRGEWGARKAILYVVDVTERKRMEDQYTQGQKLQAVGKLAGGVAHDFNNILTVIIGNCDMLMARHAVGDPSYPDLVQIQQNANRAAALVRKLLAFSRKQTLTPEILDVTEVLQDFSPFLNRTITEKVKLNFVNGRDLKTVKVDKGQLEVAIMNLAVNARDAMLPEGGVLTISTQNIGSSDVGRFAKEEIEARDYVMIEVADTGAGVASEIADKIFEPFFTTKEVGKGTGLGLSTVYGIVKQTEGHIFMESAEGEGATFRIFLPAYTASAEEAAAAAPVAPVVATPEDLTGKGKVLVVEDEDPVRSFVVRALSARGYDVIEACDGEEALEVIEANAGDIDLMVSDIMMPGLDGPALLKRARGMLGEAKVIFISGYAETAMREDLAEFDDVEFLPKPFTLKTLAAKVKESLAEKT